MMHVAHNRIGHHRGRRRLWLEGPRLSLVRFEPGARYRLRVDPDRRRIVLELRPDGERAVSGRTRKSGGVLRPIIDIAGALLERVFGAAAEKVRVVYRERQIEVALPPLAVAQARREADLVDRLSCGEALAVGSICGGAEVIGHAVHTGLEQAGVRTEPVLAADIDPEGLDVAVAANPRTRGGSLSFEGSIAELEPELVPRLDLMCVTLPCTAASLAGRAHGRHEVPEADPDAGFLVAPALALIRAASPAVVIAENVPTWANTASAWIWRRQLEAWGYSLFELALYGPDFGAYERRDRWACVAFSRGVAPEAFEVPAEPRTGLQVADVLENVPLDDERWRTREYLTRHAERHVAAGNNFKLNVVSPSDETVGVMGRCYWKGRTTEPQLRHPTDPARRRLFTPLENARLRGCPEDLAEAIIRDRSPTAATELLGQSGIWPAFAALARAVGRHLSSLARPTNVTPMPVRTAPERRAAAAKASGGVGQLALAF